MRSERRRVSTPLVIKVFRENDPHLADAVYSAIPARLVGREQEIEVGRCPGDRTIYWLESGLKPSEEMVDRIFTRAKASSTVLTEEEIRSLLNADC